MAENRWGGGFVVGVVLALVVGVAAGAVAFAPFKDSGVACGAPVTAAVHGQDALVGADDKLVAIPHSEANFVSHPLFGLSGSRLPHGVEVSVMCRRPARGRVLIAVVLLGACVFGVAFTTRRRRRESQPELAPISATI